MKHFFILVIGLSILFLSSCSERDPLNPYDPEVEASFATVILREVFVLEMHKIELSWSAGSKYYTKYLIERAEENSAFSQIAQVPNNTLSFVDTLVNNETSYSYRILGMADELCGEYSNIRTANISLDLFSLFNILAIDDSHIKLEWDYANRDIFSFQNHANFGISIERKTDDINFEEIARVSADTRIFTDSKLSSDKMYTYRLRYYLNQSFSDYVTSDTIHTVAIQPPNSLSLEIITENSMKISWLDNCTFETGFRIESKTEETDFEIVAEIGENNTNYLISDLNYNETYFFRIFAFTDYNNSDYSEIVSTKIELQPPTNLTSNLISDQEIQLLWIDNCHFETGYIIERHDSGSQFLPIATLQANSQSFLDETIIYGLEYTYRVIANSQNFESDISNETNQLVEIFAPSNLESIAVNSSILLTWNDNTNIEKNYVIERRNNESDFEQISILDSNSNSFVDENIETNILYFYRVKAVTENNESIYSNITNAIIVGE